VICQEVFEKFFKNFFGFVQSVVPSPTFASPLDTCIISHFWSFVKGFLKLFQNFFYRGLCLPLPFSIDSIAHKRAFVNRFFEICVRQNAQKITSFGKNFCATFFPKTS
jgi:hypothetical protein